MTANVVFLNTFLAKFNSSFKLANDGTSHRENEAEATYEGSFSNRIKHIVY